MFFFFDDITTTQNILVAFSLELCNPKVVCSVASCSLRLLGCIGEVGGGRGGGDYPSIYSRHN